MAALAALVYVTDPQTRAVVGFGPDDDVPDWAARLITNPAAWADGQAPQAEPDEPPTEDGETSTGDPEPPPRRGAGSGADAWRAYAKAVGVPVGADASRDDVIDALDAEGKRTD